MNIFGIGSDIVKIDRIKKTMISNSNFIKRIFTKKEISYCSKKRNKYSSFAKRFAAKEAFSKALGTGIAKGLKFNEIGIENNNLGKPELKVVGNSLKIVKSIVKKKKFNVFLTLSDDEPFAIATLIIIVK